MKNQDTLDIIAIILLVIGGVNWGIMGLFHYFDLLEHIFGAGLSQIIYVAIGLAAVYRIGVWLKFRSVKN